METIWVIAMLGIITITVFFVVIESYRRTKKMKRKIAEEPIKYEIGQNDTTIESFPYPNIKLQVLTISFMILLFICVPILYFVFHVFWGISVLMCLGILLLFVAFSNFSPYVIKLENNTLYIKQIIETNNQYLVIPMEKIEYVTYGKNDTQEIFSIIINESFTIEINAKSIQNAILLAQVITQCLQDRKYIAEEKDKLNRIKVRKDGDYIVFMIPCLAVWLLNTFVLFNSFNWTSLLFEILIPSFILKMIPYSIICYHDKVCYKHLFYTRNREKEINFDDIKEITISNDTKTVHTKNKIGASRVHRLDFQNLKIYTKDESVISIPLIFEDKGDIFYIIRLVQSKMTEKGD